MAPLPSPANFSGKGGKTDPEYKALHEDRRLLITQFTLLLGVNQIAMGLFFSNASRTGQLAFENMSIRMPLMRKKYIEVLFLRH